MAVTPLRILLFLGGATTAAVGTAFYTGALDPLLGTHMAAQPAAVANLPEPESSATPKPEAPEAGQQAAVAPAQVAAPKPDQPAEQQKAEPLSPTFDILRVEPDGSIVIAGKAAPSADVEILSGSRVLGKVTATPDGDFAAALDEALKPGDYQIVLRSTTTSRVVANSKETAVVSIPETKDGQVLALVEQPGAPSRLITKPEAPAVATAPAKPAEQAPAQATQLPSDTATAPAGEPATVQTTPPAASATTQRTKTAANVAVDAVEIEGRKIFVAGSSDPGKTVRIYANDILLGDAKTSPEGRFLIEAERDLPVGDYVVRADVLGPDGAKVIARAAVPFSREPGENIAAVAPQQPAAPQTSTAEPQSAPASGNSSASDTQPEPAIAGQPPATDPETPTGTTTATETQPAAPAPDTAQPKQQAAAPEGTELAPKLKPVDGSVIIRRGDSLWRISKRVYGRGVRYSTIYLANQEQIKDPDRIWPGQTFRVPDKTDQGEKADMKAIEQPASTNTQ